MPTWLAISIVIAAVYAVIIVSVYLSAVVKHYQRYGEWEWNIFR